jgi:ubiquinone/menaquinone biosynthesis C-methylase UbiE
LELIGCVFAAFAEDALMATFAKSTFNAARYASVRPTYPTPLYDLVLGFHGSNPGAQRRVAVDLGCGTGQVTVELMPKFDRVIAVDPSVKMLEQARDALSSEGSNVEYVQATTETLLDKMPDLEGQVNFLTAAQAAHWFKYPSVYAALKRLLRPQTGTFAFWGYSEFRFSRWQTLTPLIREYSQGKDPKTSLGPHWEPGRTIVDSLFDTIPMPTREDGFSEVKRIWYALPHHESGPDVENHPTMLKKQTTWEGLESYLRTFSSLHTFHEQNPEDKQRQIQGGNGRYGTEEGDVAQRFMGRCQAALQSEGIEFGEEVEIEWPLAVFMARRV